MNDGKDTISTTGSERDARSILETAHEAYIAMDAGGFITDWNRQAEATFGWSRQEAVGKVLADTIIPTRDREAHWQGLQHYLKTGEGPVLDTRLEIEALHREGFEFPIELTISVDRADGRRQFNALLHDITDRRRAALYVDAQHAVTRILAEAESEEEVTAGLLQALGKRMGWEYGALWRLDHESGRVRCVDVWAPERSGLERFVAVSREIAFEPGEGLPGRVWMSRRPELVADVVGDPNFPRAPEAASAGLHGAICFPLLSHEAPLGVIEF